MEQVVLQFPAFTAWLVIVMLAAIVALCGFIIRGRLTYTARLKDRITNLEGRVTNLRQELHLAIANVRLEFFKAQKPPGE